MHISHWKHNVVHLHWQIGGAGWKAESPSPQAAVQVAVASPTSLYFELQVYVAVAPTPLPSTDTSPLTGATGLGQLTVAMYT